jgi:hypothetical protein
MMNVYAECFQFLLHKNENTVAEKINIILQEKKKKNSAELALLETSDLVHFDDKDKHVLDQIRMLFNLEEKEKCVQQVESTKIIDCKDIDIKITNIKISTIIKSLDKIRVKTMPSIKLILKYFLDKICDKFIANIIKTEKKEQTKKKKPTINIKFNIHVIKEVDIVQIMELSDAFNEFENNKVDINTMFKYIPTHIKDRLHKLLTSNIIGKSKDHIYEFEPTHISLLVDIIYSFMSNFASYIIYANRLGNIKKVEDIQLNLYIDGLCKERNNKKFTDAMDVIFNEYKFSQIKKKKTSKKDADNKDGKDDSKSTETPVESKTESKEDIKSSK